MLTLIAIVWFIWELKYALFWLYLWQLKEYHVGRFVDHFRTHKGKKLIVNFEQIFKLFIFIFLFWAPQFSFVFIAVSLLLYLMEAAIVFRATVSKNLKAPQGTAKIYFLSGLSFLLILWLLHFVFRLDEVRQLKYYLSFDLLTPFIISAVVLLFQPVFVLFRNRVLEKASIKLQKIRELNNLKVIAITGSYGKTSTKEFLATILSEKYKVLYTQKHQNSEIGIAKAILNELKPSHQIFIAEVGAYNKGKVAQVCKMLKPQIGVVTGVNEQHLSLFGSMDNLISAEGGRELAEFLEKQGLLVVNGDNKYCLDLVKKFNGKEKIYSKEKDIINTEIWAENIQAHKESVSFVVNSKDSQVAHCNVNVLGGQNVQNLLGAILVAKEFGMNLHQIAEAAKNIKPSQAGMFLLHGKHGIEIVDSSYSANPDGVMADLDYLKTFLQKRVIVMPCLIELGKKSSEVHEQIGRKIAQVCDLAIITSKDKFWEIKKGATRAGMDEKNILLCHKPEDIRSVITLFCKHGDAVLLEGRVPQELINLLT